MLAKPSYKNTEAFAKYCLTRNLDAHQSWHFIPTGIFKTDRFEKSNRRNLNANNLYNDFTELYEKRGKELYIIASKLDTAERVVFGHDYIATVPISKAMQASIAIPLFYKPVKIDGEYYVDGAMVKTTSMDLAIAKGADLIVCYNPFRPFHCGPSMSCEEEKIRRHIAEDGLYAVMNQVMRTLLHTRLMHGINLYRKNPDFQGDIILIEPSEYDDVFFDMNPLAFWERRQAAKRGFDSVKQSIREYYDILSKIFHAYGIAVNPGFAEDRPL
jgi:predicted acylesterase/phospholipase RssA